MLRAERSGNGWKKCFQNPHVNFSYVSLAIDEFSWQLLASMETRKSEFYSFFTCIVEGELSGHEFEQALGVGNRQGILACCSSVWSLGQKELDMTERLSWTGSPKAPLTIPKWILCKCPNQWTINFFQFYLLFLRMTQVLSWPESYGPNNKNINK